MIYDIGMIKLISCNNNSYSTTLISNININILVRFLFLVLELEN